ncbi:MAG: DNA translocase FtsK 4TM domain-containing protein, partial [Pseudomonadota bacterium]
MALLTGENGGLPLVDRHTSLAMRRRIAELWGLALIGLMGLLAVSLWTYNAADPSFLRATGQAPRNLLGLPGAIVADGVMQFIGLAGWCLVTIFAIWALRCLGHVGVLRVWSRLPLIPLAVLATAVFASTHAPDTSWPLDVGLGGVVGDRSAAYLLGLIPLPDGQALMAMSLAMGAVTLLLTLAASGTTVPEARWLWHWLSRSFLDVVGRGARVLGLMSAVGFSAASQAAGARISKYRERREAARAAQPKFEAQEPRTWRDRMPSVSMPKVPGLSRGEDDRDLRIDRM